MALFVKVQKPNVTTVLMQTQCNLYDEITTTVLMQTQCHLYDEIMGRIWSFPLSIVKSVISKSMDR